MWVLAAALACLFLLGRRLLLFLLVKHLLFGLVVVFSEVFLVLLVFDASFLRSHFLRSCSLLWRLLHYWRLLFLLELLLVVGIAFAFQLENRIGWNLLSLLLRLLAYAESQLALTLRVLY